MTSTKVTTRTANRLKDEVYRQMFRLESKRPAADLLLALALLHAWQALEHQPENSELRQWLRTVCPLCVRMIESLPARNVEFAAPHAEAALNRLPEMP